MAKPRTLNSSEPKRNEPRHSLHKNSTSGASGEQKASVWQSSHGCLAVLWTPDYAAGHFHFIIQDSGAWRTLPLYRQ